MLQDLTGAIAQPVLIPVDGFNHIVRHFDGQSTLIEIQGRVLRSTGLFLALNQLEGLVSRLDAAMLIEGPTFDAFHRTYRESGRRPAALAGRSYAATTRALRAQLEQFFIDANGAGIPAAVPDSRAPELRGVISPHIDFQRGGPVYTWAYRELLERSTADTFVILGVAHQYCRRRFALTCKDFETPLGVVPTDRAYVDRIASLAGRDLFDDELCHRTEHSIEFQVVFLQYVLGGQREFSIVPILVGSFQDLMEKGVDPIADADVSRFVQRFGLPKRRAASGWPISVGSTCATSAPSLVMLRPLSPGFKSRCGSSIRRCWTERLPATRGAGFARPPASAINCESADWPRPTRCCTRSVLCTAACSITGRRSTRGAPAA